MKTEESNIQRQNKGSGKLGLHWRNQRSTRAFLERIPPPDVNIAIFLSALHLLACTLIHAPRNPSPPLNRIRDFQEKLNFIKA